MKVLQVLTTISFGDAVSNDTLALQDVLKDSPDTGLRKEISMYVLKQFYLQAYNPEEDFYSQFDRRLAEAAVCTKKWMRKPPV